MINENMIKGQWKEIKGEIQKKWGQLTNDDLDSVQGDVTALEGLIQKRLGMKQEKAHSELNSFLESWSSKRGRFPSSDDRADTFRGDTDFKETNF